MSTYSDLLTNQSSNTQPLTNTNASKGDNFGAFNGGGQGYFDPNLNFHPEAAPVVQAQTPQTPAPTPVKAQPQSDTQNNTPLFPEVLQPKQPDNNSNLFDTNSYYPKQNTDKGFLGSLFSGGSDKSNVDSASEGLKGIGDILGGVGSFISNTANHYLGDTAPEKGINKLKDYNNYMAEYSRLGKSGDTQGQKDIYNRMIDNNVIDVTKYNEYNSKEGAKKPEGKAGDFSIDTKKELLSSVGYVLKKNQDPYIQDLINQGATDLTSQLTGIQEIIDSSYDNQALGKADLESQLSVIKDEQKLFYQKFVEEIQKNSDDGAAYDAVISDPKYREYAKNAADFYIKVRNKSYDASDSHFNKIMENGNILEKGFGVVGRLSNTIQEVVNGGGSLLEYGKQSTLGTYDISEDLAHLGVYKETDNIFSKGAQHISNGLADIIDGAPQFVPEVLAMFVPGKAIAKTGQLMNKASKLEYLGSTIEKANKFRKLKTFGKELGTNLFIYDAIGRGMMDRGMKPEDMGLDAIISGGFSGVIAMLARPLKTMSKYKNAENMKFLNGDMYINADVVQAVKDGNVDKALAISIAGTQKGLVNDIKNIHATDVSSTEDLLHGIRDKISGGNITSGEKVAMGVGKQIAKRQTDLLKAGDSYDSYSNIASDILGHLSGDSRTIAKQGIAILTEAVGSGRLSNDSVLLALNNILNGPITKGLHNYSKEEIQAIGDYTKSVLGLGEFDKSIYDQLLKDGGDRVSSGITNAIRQTSEELIFKNNLLQNGQFYSVFKQVDNKFFYNGEEFKNSLEYLKDKGKSEYFNRLNTKNTISSLETELNKLEVGNEVNLTNILGLSGFITSNNQKFQEQALQGVLSHFGMKFDGGVYANKDTLESIIQAFKEIDNIGISTVSYIGMGAFKLKFFRQNFRKFENKFILTGGIEDTKGLTKKLFEENSIFGMWKFNDKTEKFHLDLGLKYGHTETSIETYVNNVFKSTASDKSKVESLGGLKSYSNTKKKVDSGVTVSNTLETEVDSIPAMNKIESKPLKNKLKKSFKKLETEITNKLDNNSKIQVIEDIKNSNLISSNSLLEIKNYTAEAQQDFIDDAINTIISKNYEVVGINKYNVLSKGLSNDTKNSISSKAKQLNVPPKVLKDTIIESGISDTKDSISNLGDTSIHIDSETGFQDTKKVFFVDGYHNQGETLRTVKDSKANLEDFNDNLMNTFNSLVTSNIANYKLTQEGIKFRLDLKKQLEDIVVTGTSKFTEGNKLNLVLSKIMVDDLKEGKNIISLRKKFQNSKDINIDIKKYYLQLYKDIKNSNGGLNTGLINNKLEEYRLDNILKGEDYKYIPGEGVVFNKYKNLEHYDTNTVQLNATFKSSLENKNKKLIFITDNEFNHIKSNSVGNIPHKLDESFNIGFVNIGDILTGTHKIDSNYNYLIGKATYYSRFGDIGGKKILKDNILTKGFKNDKALEFLNMDNIKGIDLNLTIKGGSDNILFDNHEGFGLLLALQDAGRFDKSLVKYKHSFENMRMHMVDDNNYLDNFYFQKIFELKKYENDNKVGGLNKKFSNNNNFLQVDKLYKESTIKSGDTTAVRGVLNSLYSLTKMGTDYNLILKGLLGEDEYANLLKKRLPINDILVDSNVFRLYKDSIATDYEALYLKKYLKFKSKHLDLFESKEFKTLSDSDKAYKVLSTFEFTNTETLKSYIYHLIYKGADPYTLLSKLPPYIRDTYIPSFDSLIASKILSGVLSHTTKTMKDFNEALLKGSKSIIHRYHLGKNKEKLVQNKIKILLNKKYTELEAELSKKGKEFKRADIAIYKEFNSYINNGSLNKIVTYNFLKQLKFKGLLNRDADLIKMNEMIPGLERSNIIKAIKSLSQTQESLSEEVTRNTVKTISDIIRGVEDKTPKPNLFGEAQKSLGNNIELSGVSYSGKEGINDDVFNEMSIRGGTRFEEDILSSIESIHSGILQYKGELSKQIPLVDMNEGLGLLSNFKKKSNVERLGVFKYLPFNYLVVGGTGLSKIGKTSYEGVGKHLNEGVLSFIKSTKKESENINGYYIAREFYKKDIESKYFHEFFSKNTGNKFEVSTPKYGYVTKGLDVVEKDGKKIFVNSSGEEVKLKKQYTGYDNITVDLKDLFDKEGKPTDSLYQLLTSITIKLKTFYKNIKGKKTEPVLSYISSSGKSETYVESNLYTNPLMSVIRTHYPLKNNSLESGTSFIRYLDEIYKNMDLPILTVGTKYEKRINLRKSINELNKQINTSTPSYSSSWVDNNSTLDDVMYDIIDELGIEGKLDLIEYTPIRENYLEGTTPNSSSILDGYDGLRTNNSYGIEVSKNLTSPYDNYGVNILGYDDGFKTLGSNVQSNVMNIGKDLSDIPEGVKLVFRDSKGKEYMYTKLKGNDSTVVERSNIVFNNDNILNYSKADLEQKVYIQKAVTSECPF